MGQTLNKPKAWEELDSFVKELAESNNEQTQRIARNIGNILFVIYNSYTIPIRLFEELLEEPTKEFYDSCVKNLKGLDGGNY